MRNPVLFVRMQACIFKLGGTLFSIVKTCIFKLGGVLFCLQGSTSVFSNWAESCFVFKGPAAATAAAAADATAVDHCCC